MLGQEQWLTADLQLGDVEAAALGGGAQAELGELRRDRVHRPAIAGVWVLVRAGSPFPTADPIAQLVKGHRISFAVVPGPDTIDGSVPRVAVVEYLHLVIRPGTVDGDERGLPMDSHAWDARYVASELVWGAEPNRWVRRETAGLTAGRALDLAAGEGRNSIWLAEHGWLVTAVDFSAVALDRARRLADARLGRHADRLTLTCADALEFRPTPGGYDLVLIAYLQLPADRRRTVLRSAADALAPGGTLLVIGHDTSNLTEGTGGPKDPDVLFTPEDVLADVEDHALTVVRAERVRRPVENPDGTVTDAIDALARLHRSRRS